MTPREQQAQHTYEHIMHTAEQLLENTSCNALSVNDICEKAGISKGGFYHHFSSKDQLIALLIGRQMERFMHKQIAPLLGKETAITLLTLCVKSSMEYLLNHPKDTLARCQLALTEHKELASSPFSQTYFELLHRIVVQGMAEGSIQKELEPAFCVNFLAASYTGIMLHALAYDEEQALETFVEKSLALTHQIIS